MTVRELIERLEKVEDKDDTVIFVEGGEMCRLNFCGFIQTPSYFLFDLQEDDDG